VSCDWIAADWPAPAEIIAGTTLKNSLLELPAEPRWLNQVHGNRAVRLDSEEFDIGKPDADAVVADEPGSICVVRTADCLPVLLTARDGSEIAAIHVGWRGLAAGVIEETLKCMRTPANQQMAWLGPAISQSAFEVGDEVRQAFVEVSAAAEAAFEPNRRGRWQADLYRLARQRLAGAGLDAVYGGGLCTFEDSSRFYSYRRDKDKGRMVSFVYRAA
jgi:YfiH family protein